MKIQEIINQYEKVKIPEKVFDQLPEYSTSIQTITTWEGKTTGVVQWKKRTIYKGKTYWFLGLHLIENGKYIVKFTYIRNQ